MFKFAYESEKTLEVIEVMQQLNVCLNSSALRLWAAFRPWVTAKPPPV